MIMPIFRPDNFSTSTVSFKEIKSDKNFFNEILKNYFVNFKIIRIFQLDRPEINSQNYKIILELDGKRTIYLLRQYRVLSDKKQIEFYLQFLRSLYNQNLPVSQPVVNLKNNFLVVADKKIYSLFVFINGNYFVANKPSLASVAKSIARIHKRFNEVESNYVGGIKKFSKKSYTYFNKIRNYSKRDFESVFKIIENKKKKSSIDLALLASRDSVWRTLDEVGKLKKEKKLPSQIIHSDLHPHNILMKNNKVMSVLDFDAVRLSEQARDVAVAVLRFGRQFILNKNLKKARVMAPQIKNIFLENYIKYNNLSTKEMKLMPLLLKDEFLRKLLFVLNGVYKDNNLTWANDLVKFISSLEEINYFWPH